MKKIRLSTSANIEETFREFIISKRAKGLADKTLETYQSQFRTIAKHLDAKQDISVLTRKDLDAMLLSMRDAGLSLNSIKSYTCVLKSFFS